MKVRKILIAMSDTGGGHRSAAEALATVITNRYGDAFQVTIADLISDYTFWPLSQLRHAYAPVVHNAEPLYRFSYWLPKAPARWWLMRQAITPLVRERMGQFLQQVEPDLFVSVHSLLIDIPHDLLRKAGNNCPIAVVVTDLGSGHPTWFSPNADLITLGSQALYEVARSRGISAARIKPLGLPVSPRFIVPAQDQAVVRQALGLAPDRPLALLIGGGEGMGPLHEIACALAAALQDVNGQLAVICGRNERLRAELQAETWPVPVAVQGFVRNMSEWMLASDCVVTKAGPGTIVEACIVGRPIMLSGFVVGQEAGNVTYVVENGIGAYSQQPAEIGRIVADWLRPGNPALAEMAARARAMAKPHATNDIVDAVLSLLD